MIALLITCFQIKKKTFIDIKVEKFCNIYILHDNIKGQFSFHIFNVMLKVKTEKSPVAYNDHNNKAANKERIPKSIGISIGTLFTLPILWSQRKLYFVS